MATNLGKKLAGQVQAPAPAKSQLAAVLEHGARGELVELRGLGVAWLRLIGHEEVQDIEGLVMKRMAARGLEPTMLHGLSYDAERAQLTLARGVRHPEEREKPFGTVEEWGQVDPDTLANAWLQYADLRSRLSPLDVEMTPDLRGEIFAAISKKNATLLRSYDVCTLASFLLSTEFPPATPPTTTSTTGPSQPES